MTKIYTSPQFSQRFVAFTDEKIETIKHDFIINANNLTYKFTVGTEEIYNFSISLAEFKSSPRFTEQCWFAFNDTFVNTSNTQVISKLAGLTEFDRNSVLNCLDYSSIGKSNNLSQPRGPGWNIPIKLFVKCSSDDFTTMEYNVHVPSQDNECNHSTVVTLNGDEYTLEEPKQWKTFISPITATTTATTVNPGDDISVSVSTDPAINFVYLEKVIGSIDRNKVALTNGQGTFNMSTTGLDSGDVLEVKLGYKSFTGVTSFKKSIS